MTDQFKNIVIGMFVIAACVIVIFLLLFLHPSPGNKGEKLRALFTEIDKINVGSRVTFAGKPVGEVTEIKEVEFARNGPKDENGHVYIYELTFAVDSSVKVFNTDEISLRTSGLLGERSVAIIPLAPKPGVTVRQLTDKDTIYAVSVSSVEDAMRELKSVAAKLDVTLDHANDILIDITEEEVIKKFGDTLDNMRDITATLNKPEELNAILDNFTEFSDTLARRLPKSWDIVDKSLDQVHMASEQLHSAAEHANTFTVSLNEITDKVKRGEGTAGKILVKDDLYLRLTSLLSKGDTVMNDVNHYGILFHLDKGWQRMRARRANLLLKLSSPQQFRNYFNDEVDQISSSLERVSMVLDKTNNQCFPLALDPEFTKVFAELLRRVEDVESSLKMYDQQLMETKVQETELIPCYTK